MNGTLKRRQRCAVYCRVSSDERLDQSFNSIDAQKEAGHAYVASQRSEGWIPVADDYDDGGFSGGNMERPALRRLMADIEEGKVDIVVSIRSTVSHAVWPIFPRWSKCLSALGCPSSQSPSNSIPPPRWAD